MYILEVNIETGDRLLGSAQNGVWVRLTRDHDSAEWSDYRTIRGTNPTELEADAIEEIDYWLSFQAEENPADAADILEAYNEYYPEHPSTYVRTFVARTTGDYAAHGFEKNVDMDCWILSPANLTILTDTTTRKRVVFDKNKPGAHSHFSGKNVQNLTADWLVNQTGMGSWSVPAITELTHIAAAHNLELLFYRRLLETLANWDDNENANTDQRRAAVIEAAKRSLTGAARNEILFPELLAT